MTSIVNYFSSWLYVFFFINIPEGDVLIDGHDENTDNCQECEDSNILDSQRYQANREYHLDQARENRETVNINDREEYYNENNFFSEQDSTDYGNRDYYYGNSNNMNCTYEDLKYHPDSNEDSKNRKRFFSITKYKDKASYYYKEYLLCFNIYHFMDYIRLGFPSAVIFCGDW
eukprot:CAMPEP_0170519438 /NCGR_PEP_ID=MMETSP0209-20121228/4854_1 /TAXON_ID=665100 ORGANISM="Litonotus pictus, Strain P1" /NCGR_SAMPLE_ID=MMETSP0209 /ASSEMBLY_ACC=CAM_ASM_000301 /LENGTH=172 /DNA_ID=CAMNT_0010805319 /DNA_START=968 /DNA_END=1483 /DNA_ORIENTATION=+